MAQARSRRAAVFALLALLALLTLASLGSARYRANLEALQQRLRDGGE